ncbi:hypothetical protein JG688_00012114, partial [Phytophthora aleatoria]
VEAFLRRHKFSIRRRTRERQSHPVDAEQNTEEFSKQVRLKMQERGVAVVYNADQTVYSRCQLRVCAYYTCGAEIVWVKCTGKVKERVVSMLLAASDGAKREHFLVFKTCASTKPDIARENKVVRHAFRCILCGEIKPLQHGVHIYGNAAGWLNSDL